MKEIEAETKETMIFRKPTWLSRSNNSCRSATSKSSECIFQHQLPRLEQVPIDGEGWKPLSMGAGSLLSFAAISLVLAGVIEYLAQSSRKNGGLAFSESPDEYSSLTNFSYLFLPTILAVIYSMAWSFIDLDVKRLQPWLELSRPEGTTAENSLFLDYPFEFIVFVPFKAARQK